MDVHITRMATTKIADRSTPPFFYDEGEEQGGGSLL